MAAAEREVGIEGQKTGFFSIDSYDCRFSGERQRKYFLFVAKKREAIFEIQAKRIGIQSGDAYFKRTTIKGKAGFCFKGAID
jgi:hypothetical protein